MELVEVDPGDRTSVRDYAAAREAARRVDAPWLPPLTEHEVEGRLRYGWDLEPAVGHLVVAGGEVVGWADYETSEYDNHHLAWLRFDVHPDHRRRGHASRALRLALDHLRSLGLPRALLTVEPANLPSTRVVLAHGGVPDGQAVEPSTGHVVHRYGIDLPPAPI